MSKTSAEADVPWNALRRERWSDAGRRAAIVLVDHRPITSFAKPSEAGSMPRLDVQGHVAVRRERLPSVSYWRQRP
jgi:hypothetical protein